jgi:hypothetical protein
VPGEETNGLGTKSPEGHPERQRRETNTAGGHIKENESGFLRTKKIVNEVDEKKSLWVEPTLRKSYVNLISQNGRG